MIPPAASGTVTVILPCAGEGRRLGYDGHKELFPILPGVRLIDFSLEHIAESCKWLRAVPGWDIRVVVVIRPSKMDIIEYVRQKLPDISVTHVPFDTNLVEWPGSVHSAREHYGDINLVLLPDTRMALSHNCLTRDRAGYPVLFHVMRCLQRHTVAFGYQRCRDAETLHRLGAVHVIHVKKNVTVIDRFQDKPDTGFDRFNGFWCCYAFTRPSADILYRFLRKSVLHEQADISVEPFHPAAAFSVSEYRDLGTPDAVRAFQTVFGCDSSSSNNSSR
jgi:hypothetical protein